MISKAEYSTADLLPNTHCGCCGWPVIIACCNHSFTNYKNSNEFDRWVYCTNKGCDMHAGEGMDQSRPEWLISKN